jgi:hypothetical protein
MAFQRSDTFHNSNPTKARDTMVKQRSPLFVMAEFQFSPFDEKIGILPSRKVGFAILPSPHKVSLIFSAFDCASLLPPFRPTSFPRQGPSSELGFPLSPPPPPPPTGEEEEEE